MIAQRIPSSRQASAVVPEPPKGSSTSPSNGVTSRTRYCIRATGLTVAWASLRAGSPHFPQTLVSDHFGNMARSASPVERPPFLADVPVFCVDEFEFAAESAGFPPFAPAQFTSAVDALVLRRRDRDEVVGAVVEFVAVKVVDLVPFRDRLPVMLFPDFDVFELEGDAVSSVSLTGDGVGHESSQSHDAR
jgi:hypothetical protein